MNNQGGFFAPEQTQGTIWICSVDIGSVNFAFYIEEIDKKSLIKIKNIPDPKSRYNANGTPTKKMQKILDAVCKNGKTILHKNSDISKNCVKGKKLDQNTFYNMTDLLDSYGDYWDKCCCFVVEQQMNFGKAKRNPKALKLGHHCQSYFMFRYGRFKEVMEFPAYHKTQVLGCEKIRGKKYKNGNYRWKSIDKPARKKWSVVKATEILVERGEEDTIQNIKTKAKKDDLADTLTQLQAFKYLCFVDRSI
jgi:hypothetical protein